MDFLSPRGTSGERIEERGKPIQTALLSSLRREERERSGGDSLSFLNSTAVRPSREGFEDVPTPFCRLPAGAGSGKNPGSAAADLYEA
jgi:hypothetical protein